MQRTNIWEGAGIREGDAEACHAERRLGEPKPFLWRGDDEPRMGTVGSGIDDRMPGPIRVHGHVGGRWAGVSLRLGSKSNGMRNDRILIIPFDRLSGADFDIVVRKAQGRDSASLGLPFSRVLGRPVPWPGSKRPATSAKRTLWASGYDELAERLGMPALLPELLCCPSF